MEQAENQVDPQDFVLKVYRGCVLPEDYKPVRVTTWRTYAAEHAGEYTDYQFELVRRRLLSGKSWVTFAKSLETISAAEYYRPLPLAARNPIWHRERLV